MTGPPGTGKSMLAQRLPGLLPPLDDEAALESAAVLSLAGQFDISRWGQRPRGAGGRWLAATAGRDLAGAARHFVFG